jgi:hypothetical protein
MIRGCSQTLRQAAWSGRADCFFFACDGFVSFHLSLVVTGDFNIIGVAVCPFEADSPLIVDTYALS